MASAMSRPAMDSEPSRPIQAFLQAFLRVAPAHVR
jgi:hypothetical protein